MSDIDILPPMLTRIGFSELDINVYTAVLGLGKVTIGELLVIIGSDPLSLIQSVKNLEELGFLKKIPSESPQYFAMLPFLQQAIVVERDSMYGIDGILNSLEKANNKYQEARTNFGGKLELDQDDHFFDIHVVSGLIKQLVDSIYQNYLNELAEIENLSENFLEQFKEEINKEINPLIGYPLSFSNELENYVQELSAFIKQFKHTASTKQKQFLNDTDKQIEESFQDLREILLNGLDSHVENHKDFLEKVPQELDIVLKEYISEVTDIQNSFIESYNKTWEKAYNTWIEHSDKLVKDLSGQVNDIFTAQIKETQDIRRAVEQIDRKINYLSSKITEVNNVLESSSMISFGKTKKQIGESLQEIRESIKNLGNDLSESGLQLIDKQVINLNEIRDQIRTNLDKFQISGSTDIRTKKKQITADSIEKIELLPSNILDDIQTKTENYAKNAFDSCNNVSEKLKTTINNELDNAKTEISDNLKNYGENNSTTINDLQNSVIDELTKTKMETQEYGEKLQEKTKKQLKRNEEVIKDQKAEYKTKLNEFRENNKTMSEETKEKLVQQITEAEDIQITSLVSQVASVVKNMDEAIMSQTKEIKEKGTAFFSIVNTREAELKQINKAAQNVKFEGTHSTSIIVGEEAIMASLTAMAMEAKYNLLLITPEVNEKLLKEMMEYTKAQRITLVSRFDKKKEQLLLRSISDRFTGVKFKYYEGNDVYFGLQDNTNEAILAFRVLDEIPVAVKTSNERLLQLFKSEVNRDVLFRTSDIEL